MSFTDDFPMIKIRRESTMKKILSLLLTVRLVSALFSPMATLAETITVSNVIAEDMFLITEYTGGSEANMATSYAGSVNPGKGWSEKWSTSPDSYVEPVEADKIQCYGMNLKQTSESTAQVQKMMKLNQMPAGTNVYRQLKDSIIFSNSNMHYEFSVDVADTLSDSWPGVRKSFRFYIGDQFYIGYDRKNSGAEIKPLIGVGGSEELAETNLVVGGGTTDGEFVTFKVSVDLDPEGDDTITLTARERQDYQLSGAWAKGISTDVSEVSVTTELDGAVEYIGIGSKADTETRLYIQNIIITESESADTLGDVDESKIAEDVFGTEAGYASWSDNSFLADQYPLDGITKDGWGMNWSSSESRYSAPADSVVTYNGLSKSIRMTSKTDKIYRTLKKPISTVSRNALYSFSFSASEAMEAYQNRANACFSIGNVLNVGYEWTDSEHVTPYISIDGNKYTNGTLKTYAGEGEADIVNYEVKLSLNSEGKDLVTLTAKDRQNNNSANADPSETVIVRAFSQITDPIDYIGLSYTGDSDTTSTDFYDIMITGADFTAYEIMNIKDGDTYDKEATISWDESFVGEGCTFEDISIDVTCPGGTVKSDIDNETSVVDEGEYTLTIKSTANGFTYTLPDITFKVLPDVAPTATDVKIRLKEGSTVETGSVLTGTYKFSDENKEDQEGSSEYVWYIVDKKGQKTKVGDQKDYTITEDDEGYDFIFEVTPVSDSEFNSKGEATESDIFTGAYAPEAKNLQINGDMEIGAQLYVTYDYEDINGDKNEGETEVKWYEYGDLHNIEITENVSSGVLTITKELMGKEVYAEVTPVSKYKPFIGEAVATSAIEIVKDERIQDDEQQTKSDFPCFEKDIAEDVVHNYTGLQGKSGNVNYTDYTYAKVEGSGFAHNWSSELGEYKIIGGLSAFFQMNLNTWMMSYRGPQPVYRAFEEPIDFSQTGTYTFTYDVYEFNGDGNILGSDHRIYIGSTDWYFGYLGSSGSGGSIVYIPQIMVPGKESATEKGHQIVYKNQVMRVRLDVEVTDGEDTFKLKMWYVNDEEPSEYDVITTGEIGNLKARYLAYTPTTSDSGNSTRYVGFSAKFDNPGVKAQFEDLTKNPQASEEEITSAFEKLSKYPDGAKKDSYIRTFKGFANGSAAATAKIVESNPEKNGMIAAHDLKTVSVKYNLMIKDGSVFKLKDNRSGNYVNTKCYINENKVTLIINDDVHSATEYTVVTDNATDYKGDPLPELSFRTYSIPKFNVTDKESYGEQSYLNWTIDGEQNVIVSITTPDGNISDIQSGYNLQNSGKYTLVAQASKNGYNDSVTIAFTVNKGVEPVAKNVRIIGMHETGATLTGKYTFADENKDLEGISLYNWYRVNNGAERWVSSDPTYTLTADDENCDIIFEVTPVSDSLIMPQGETVRSASFAAAYKPAASNLKIAGNNISGEYLRASYDYYDKNGDSEGKSVVRWFLENGTEITDNITDGKLKITEDLYEKRIYLELTPVSTKKPYEGDTLRTDLMLMPSRPVVSNVIITGEPSVGNRLTADYIFADPNNEVESISKYEWKNVNTGEVLETNRTILLTNDMVGMTIAVTVTGMTEKIPADSIPVTSSPVTVRAGANPKEPKGDQLSGTLSGSKGASTVKPAAPEEEIVFNDITNHWAENAIIELLKKNIISKDSKFRPDDKISRAEVLALILRSNGTQLSTYKDSFEDVLTGDWFAQYVQTALDEGIVSPDKKFRPNDSITREETAKIIACMLNLNSDKTASYNDTEQISQWAVPYVNAVSAAGIFKGNEKGNFNPKSNLTRAEAATVIYTILNTTALEDGGAR